jgi:hypothetical protein
MHLFAASLPFAEALVERRTANDATFAAGIDRQALDDPPLFIPLKLRAALAEALARKVVEPLSE